MNTQTSAKNLANLYDQDFNLWIEATTQALHQGKFEQLDLENLIEEIESLGRSDKRALRSQLIRVIKHILKLKYQPNLHYSLNSWRSSVVEGRGQVKQLLKDSPSLNPYLAQVFEECYQDGKQETVAETGLDSNLFPDTSEFSLEQILDPGFWP